MAKATAQQCHALTTYFVSAVEAETDKKPTVNRNKARWGFESMLMDYAPADVRQLIDYYVKHYDHHNIDWFLFNYEKVEQAMKEHNENELRQAKRRKETQERLEQWRNRWQK